MEKILKDVQERLKISDENFKEYLEDVEQISKVLDKENIKFLPDFKLVFYSHMVSLIQRLKENIPLDCGDEYPDDEINKRAIQISEDLIIPLTVKYKRELDKLEIILAAIQLHLALEIQEEE